MTDGPDVVIGGDDHQRMAVHSGNDRWVYKADAKTVSILRITLTPAHHLDLSHRFVRLDANVPEDEQAKREVERWLTRFDQEYETANCNRISKCLDEGSARSPQSLIGDEQQVRSGITTLGTWVAHEMLKLAATCVPTEAPRATGIAVINAGALRINGDIAANSPLTVRDVEEILPFNTTLRVGEITGATLHRLFAQSLRNRGRGGWLQFNGVRMIGLIR